MLVMPDTVIRLIKNCPLDKTYDHTLYFDDEQEQIRYFKNTLDGIMFPRQNYQRYEKGVLHIQEKAENLYDCNYLMFQNSAFGNKWFYAFVTSVEYVNNVSSRVTYEIDVMQTWFFNYGLGHCYVEREHTLTDNPGDNLIPERLDTGEFVLTKVPDDVLPFPSGEYDIVIAQGTVQATVIDGDTGKYDNRAVVSNVFSGIDFTRYQDPAEAYVKLKELNDNNKSDEVVAVFQIPRAMWGVGAGRDFWSSSLVQEVGQNLTHDYSVMFKNNPLDDNEIGYTPKNKKLYTAPFFGILVTSSSGENKKYAYEYFLDPCNPKFGLVFSTSAMPEAVLTPQHYKGVVNNIGEELLCKDFPQCAYATDTFRAYLAQNAGRIMAGVGGTIINASNRRDSDRSLISNVLRTVGEFRDISVLPDKPRGNSISYINYTRNTAGFMLYQYKIRKEYAIIIDNYFNMFGYAVNALKVPNRNGRPHWNYVKTGNCVLTGSIPADDTSKICSIYNNGITFWKKGNEVGDYSLDNSPT